MAFHRQKRVWNRAFFAIALSYVLALQSFFTAAAVAQPRADLVQIICSHGDSSTPIHQSHDRQHDCCRTMVCCAGFLALGSAALQIVAFDPVASRLDPSLRLRTPARAGVRPLGFNARGPPLSI